MKRILFIFVVISSVLFAGCSSSTYITSEPEGANVYINNSLIGQTPIVYSDSKIALTCVPITIEKAGYKKINTIICKDGSVNVAPAVGGFFFFPAWLWVMGYNPTYNFYMESEYTTNPDNTELPYTVQDNPQETKAQKLLDLKKLYDEGVITQEEYEKEKKKILDSEDW